MPTVSNVTKVLFVCVHNAGRSRMAEAMLRHLGGSHFEVTSAGFEPRQVDTYVARAMASIDMPIEHSAAQPSVFELFRAGRHFHYVISVCDEIERERCPIFPGVTQRLSWTFPDPTSAIGTPVERLARTAEVRDAIRTRLEEWLQSF